MGKRDRKRSRDYSGSDEDRQHRKHKHEKHKKKKSKHKKHKRSSGSDSSSSSGSEGDRDARLAAAQAFLQQHLATNPPAAHLSAAGGPLLPPGPPVPAAAGDVKGSKKSSKGHPSSKGPGLPAGVPALTADHYFEKSAEFTAWLLTEQHKYFNELSSEESHAWFDRFVASWNAGALPPTYYQGLVAAPLKRTSHQWGFKGAAGHQPKRVGVGMAAWLEEDKERRDEQRTASRAADTTSRKAWRREQREQLDDLLPKPTAGTREAKVEARAARREAARARDESPDRAWVTGGGDIMGGDDSLAAAKAREAKRQEWRSQKAAAQRENIASRATAAAEAEAAKMAQFRQLLSAAGTITIPKRAPQQ